MGVKIRTVGALLSAILRLHSPFNELSIFMLCDGVVFRTVIFLYVDVADDASNFFSTMVPS